MLAIFDHDGVLVDSLDFHTQAWIELGQRENLPIDAEFVRQTFGLTNFMIFERLFDRELPREEAVALGERKEQCYRDLARGKIDLMAGVRELIDNLTAHEFGVSIGSSGPRPNLFLTVESCGLDGRFRSIVGLEDIRRGKPDPEVFLKAAAQAGVEPARCVVFEDAVFGIEAAKAAGMYAVGVGTTNPLQILTDAGADEVVETLEGFHVPTLEEKLKTRA
jgi:HAD superfamily hydrolase (TIGR01509 family)